MSKYTTELRYICETMAGYDDSQGYKSVDEIIAKSRDKLIPFKYPIFDEKYRNVLNTKIIKHFYTREIGFETIGLFQMKMDTLMNEIMPKYNRMYTEYGKLDNVFLFNDTDYATTHDDTQHSVTGENTDFVSGDKAHDTSDSITDSKLTRDMYNDKDGHTNTIDMTVDDHTTKTSYGKIDTLNGNDSTVISGSEFTNILGKEKSSNNASDTSNESGNSSNTNSGKVYTRNVQEYSDTPQSGAGITGGGDTTGPEYGSDVKINGKYLTNVTSNASVTDNQDLTESNNFSNNSSSTSNASGELEYENRASSTTYGFSVDKNGNKTADERKDTKTFGSTNTLGGEDTVTESYKNSNDTWFDENSRDHGTDITHTETKDDKWHTDDFTSNNKLDRDIVTTDNYIDHIAGKVHAESYLDMLPRLRTNLLNIDMYICDDLEELFMQIW